MADNLDTTATVSTVPVATKIATRNVTYSGDANSQIAPVGLVAFAGADDAKTVADIPGDATNGLDVDVTRIVPGTAATNLGKAVDSAVGATDTGVAALAVRDDVLSALTPADGDYTRLFVDALGALWTHVMASAAGGATPYKLISAATTNSQNVKASAGQVYMIVVTNINAAVRYLKLYNKATAPTVGTDTPVQVYAIPGSTTGGGIAIPIPAVGLAFSLGIGLGITTGAADNDTGAVAANEIIVNLGYA